MKQYSQEVINHKPEFSYLNTSEPLKSVYRTESSVPYAPETFPYAKPFMLCLLREVYETYRPVLTAENAKLLCKELGEELKHDFYFDFSDHLGGMRQRDKRGAEPSADENGYNLFHSCYKFVNQAARSKVFGKKFNLSLMSGRVNTDNPTGPEICDPFNYGPALYLYPKTAAKVTAMTLPGLDSARIAQLSAFEKELKKDLLTRKAKVFKEVKTQWHELINKKLMPSGMGFGDLSSESAGQIAELSKEYLNSIEQDMAARLNSDADMLHKIASVLNKQASADHPAEDLSRRQLACLHAMQGNEVLKNSSVVQISIEAEKPIYNLMADILEDPNSLTAQILQNPHTRKIFETEIKNIHTTKDAAGYSHLLNHMEPAGSKFPSYSKTLGTPYDKEMSAREMAEELRSGRAMPQVSFMLGVLLMETGAKIEGGSSQIVYANRIKKALDKVFETASGYPEFDKFNLQARHNIIGNFEYRTAQAQIWGTKGNAQALTYRDLANGNITVNDKLLDKIASLPADKTFEAASAYRFYQFLTGKESSPAENTARQKEASAELIHFSDPEDYSAPLREGGHYYTEIKKIMLKDPKVGKAMTLPALRYQKNFGY